MRTINKAKVILLIYFMSTLFLTGCTNWKKKYQALNVEHQNLRGLYELMKSERGELKAKVSQDQQTIEDLQKQIAERNQSPAMATGFGQGYNVSVDAQAGTITVTLPNTILFDPGKAVLKKATSAELNHIESVLQSRYPGRQIGRCCRPYRFRPHQKVKLEGQLGALIAACANGCQISDRTWNS